MSLRQDILWSAYLEREHGILVEAWAPVHIMFTSNKWSLL